MGDEDPHLQKVEFWQKLAGFAFACWAIAIPIGVAMIRASVSEAVAFQQAQSRDFAAYVLAMERRITLIEERQQKVLQTLQVHENRFEAMNGKR